MAEVPVGEGAEDELRALLGDGPVPFPRKLERQFQPWHRPRKQYVRRAQWSREIGMLVRDLRLTGELRYLTLPGSDLLDIRHLGESVCTPREVRLKYLGFNTAASPLDANQPELNASQFSVNRLEYVHPESEVFPGDFRSIGNPRSIPWQRLRRAGPFHAINLDLCGGFAGRTSGDGLPNYFAALQAVLQNQATSDEEFVLLLTTRMDENSVDGNARELLNELTQRIFDSCQAYASEFFSAWGMTGKSGPLRLSDLVGAAEGLMLGLTQWIVSEGVAHGLKASVRSFMTYRTGVGVGADDIVSLAIRFKPDPYIQPDPQGLVGSAGPGTSLAEKECEQSAKIPSRVSKRVLIDEILRTQAAEFERCVTESSNLLTAAGYDATSYLSWVTQEEARRAT